jgi:hypothetical protein
MLHKDGAEEHFAMGSACMHAMNKAKGNNERTGRRNVAPEVTKLIKRLDATIFRNRAKHL